MAINFVTGLPRAGKTLWTIATVKARADKENRAVYTCNIPGVTVPGWQTIEKPDDWMSVPDAAIIIVDELQDFWQKGAMGSRVPLPILELSKHGKRGIEFYFITQEPNLVHQTPRDLCAHHFYVVRAWGSNNAMVHKFERMQLHPEKQKRLSEKIPFRYPKEVFDWYKSAEVHMVRREIPKKVFAIPLVLLLAGFSIYAAIYLGKSAISKAQGAKPTAATISSQGNLSTSATSSANHHVTATQLVDSYKPRIDGFAQTAPRYDDATKPVTAPYPAACVRMGERCDCYTQQATRLTVPVDVCHQIVRNGYFVDWQTTNIPPGSQPATHSNTDKQNGAT